MGDWSIYSRGCCTNIIAVDWFGELIPIRGWTWGVVQEEIRILWMSGLRVFPCYSAGGSTKSALLWLEQVRMWPGVNPIYLELVHLANLLHYYYRVRSDNRPSASLVTGFLLIAISPRWKWVTTVHIARY